LVDKLLEPRDATQLFAFLLRVAPENGFRQHHARFAPGLGHGQDMSRTDFELPFAAVGVAVSLIECLAPRVSDFKHKTWDARVEKINSAGALRAPTMPNE
jgi:hypothetical protein